MDTLLIGVSIVSLVLAAAMGVVAWTLIRADRERSAARIEALEAMAFEPPEAAEPPGNELTYGNSRPALSAPSADVRPALPRSAAPAIEPPQWDLPLALEPAAPPARTSRHRGDAIAAAHAEHMFEPRASTAGGRRWLGAVAAAGLIAVAGYVVVNALRSSDMVAALAATTSAQSSSDASPIELVSLRHAAGTDGSFVVTGLIQNPTGGHTLSSLEAVVYLFDQNDQFFTTGRAAVDAITIGPGTEAAFEIRVPNVSGVTRYRVGFRQGDGSTVAHVDRRGHGPEDATDDAISVPDVVRPAGGIR